MLKMFEKGTKQKGYRYLIQKNARCPVCAGTLRHREGGKDIKIFCINCGVKMVVVDYGQTEGEYTVEVL